MRFGLVLIAVACTWAQTDLPARRVVLYKNGVGYFEHVGKVQGTQDVGVRFTSGQLNDVLKSLTVLDLNGGRVTGIAYDSEAPVEKRMEELRLNIGEKGSLTEFLSALRGAKVEVKTAAATLVGRLLSVERKTRMGGTGNTVEVEYVSLVTETGEVRTMELTSGFSVRLVERELAGRVDQYLNLLGQSRQADVRRLTISTAGTGERSLFVSYISEVPVWKTTYRLVLGEKTGPLLQGWAIVDNTVGQDWNNVELSLVAGAPQSFIQNISQPHYARRPVIAMRDAGSLTPQTHEATLRVGNARVAGRVTDPGGIGFSGATVRVLNPEGVTLAEAYTRPDGSFEVGGLPEGEARIQAQAPGFQAGESDAVRLSASNQAWRELRLRVGGVAESMNVQAAPYPMSTEASSSVSRLAAGSGAGVMRKAAPPPPPPRAASAAEIDAARNQVQAAAQGQDIGDLYEYKLKEPVTIARNRSALVPILQSKIEAEKVSIWNDAAGSTRARRGLWLTNSSGSTLDSGTFSVTEGNTFAGEGLLDSVKAGEKRLISYALDSAVTVSSKESRSPQRVARVRIANGIMTHESEVRESRTYTFRNEDDAPRVMLVEHRARPGYELRGDVKPVETTPGLMRFRLPIPAKQTATLEVPESRPMQSTWSVSDLSGPQVTAFLQQGSIDKSIEDALRRVLAQKDVIAAIQRRIQERSSEDERIVNDQERLRENMKALKGTPEEKALLQRYTMQLNEQENRLETLRKEAAALHAEEEKAEAELNRMIRALSFDVKL